ncbi:membrane protein insertase YidC [Desulfobacterales bacterium HSG16]|nr:membrane protein insertase YidC [Desulfobacterales bacterium HSG16]
MEQVRLIIALTLSLLVFVLWSHFFAPEEVKRPPANAPEVSRLADTPSSTQTGNSTQASSSPVLPPTTQPAYAEQQKDLRKARTITVDTPLYSVDISERGGVFKSFVLKNYKETIEADSPLKQLIPEDLPNGTLLTGFGDGSLANMEYTLFSVNSDTDMIDAANAPKSLTFVLDYNAKDGAEKIVVEKTFSFSPETYLIQVDVKVKNQTSGVFKDHLFVSLVNPEPGKASVYSFEGPGVMIDSKVEQISLKDIRKKKKDKLSGSFSWMAYIDRYFLSAVVAREAVPSGVHLRAEGNFVESRYLHPNLVIGPGEEKVFSTDLYFGPKSLTILKEMDNGLFKVIDFGWFDFIARPCLWLMNFIYGFIPNYGVAIILLTLMIKVILWPLGNKSYKSMNAMKKLQPMMQEIRDKYKDNKQKMNEEMMNLYKTYKINPMSGCLPMLLQIPVLFAFYRMLLESIELRHAPFFGWITDLSAPDRLFAFDGTIPLLSVVMSPPMGIPVLTIIMGASMFIQQKMSPPPGDPTQAKIMMLMPIFFTFIFLNFSSGLVLYWLVNNILALLQQYYVSKKQA